MHIGSTSVFDRKLTHRKLVNQIKERIHLLPRYQQKVQPDPFNLGHPTWEADNAFDIRKHIIKVKQKKALSETELVKAAGEILTEVLDRNKPLWELHIIEDIGGGRSAMVAKIHHCMVDGISGVDLVKIMFDLSPNPAPTPRPEIAQVKEIEKDATQKFFESLIGGMQETVTKIVEMQNGLLTMATNLAKPETAESLPHLSNILPAVAAPPPMLPFNGKCSGERRLAWQEFSFADARKIKNVLGGTVNDVVLTVLSETVGRYTKFHKQKIKGKIVRFMVPVSLRQKDQRGALGNLISILPVEIPLDIKELPRRFNYVNQKTAVMKEAKLAEGLMMFGALYSMIPAPLQSVLGQLADLPFPPFNMVATNVPGPQVPLYLAGRKMTAHYPYVPIGYGLGLGCAIFSYNQSLFFGLSSDALAMPDVEKFNEIMNEVFDDLMSVVGELENQTTNTAGAGK